MLLQGLVLPLIVHFLLTGLQDGDARPQMIAPTYATVRRTGSSASAKRTEGNAGWVTTVAFLHDIQNLNTQRSSSAF
jgi:hypothetical protein